MIVIIVTAHRNRNQTRKSFVVESVISFCEIQKYSMRSHFFSSVQVGSAQPKYVSAGRKAKSFKCDKGKRICDKLWQTETNRGNEDGRGISFESEDGRGISFAALCWLLTLVCARSPRAEMFIECQIVLTLADGKMSWGALMCVDCHTRNSLHILESKTSPKPQVFRVKWYALVKSVPLHGFEEVLDSRMWKLFLGSDV
jgi:hypothetical protein